MRTADRRLTAGVDANEPLATTALVVPTARRLPDCLIAVLAIRAGAALLHRDSDFDAIARHAPLAIVE